MHGIRGLEGAHRQGAHRQLAPVATMAATHDGSGDAGGTGEADCSRAGEADMAAACAASGDAVVGVELAASHWLVSPYPKP